MEIAQIEYQLRFDDFDEKIMIFRKIFKILKIFEKIKFFKKSSNFKLLQNFCFLSYDQRKKVAERLFFRKKMSARAFARAARRKSSFAYESYKIAIFWLFR